MGINIQLIKQGDGEEFERFVHSYRGVGENFAMNMVHDRGVAQEIVQDSFVKIYVNRDKIDEHLSLKSYFFTIIKHKVIDYMRKTKREVYHSFSIEVTPSPEDRLLKEEKNRVLNEQINGLKATYRLVLYLYVYQEMSYREIGEVLGKTEGQVKALMFRARKKLKSKLGHALSDYGIYGMDGSVNE